MIQKLEDINMKCEEGQLLIAALTLITTMTKLKTNETPFQVLGEVIEIKNKLF